MNVTRYVGSECFGWDIKTTRITYHDEWGESNPSNLKWKAFHAFVHPLFRLVLVSAQIQTPNDAKVKRVPYAHETFLMRLV